MSVNIVYFDLKIMTDPDVPGPSDPYLREHLHWSDMINKLLFTILSCLLYINYNII